MNATIYKYALAIVGHQFVDMPRGARLLGVINQVGNVVLYAMVIPSEPIESRGIRIYGTGHEIVNPLAQHVGTVQQGPFVWHVFDARGESPS